MSLPAKIQGVSDLTLVKLAREIAVDHFSIEEILEKYEIPQNAWDVISKNPRFQELLREEIAAWQSAANTHERTKLKAAALIEEWLPEANKRLHDDQSPLSGRVELAKLVARIAGMGLTNANIEGGGGERFSVTINLGGDAQLKFEKQLPPKVIDGELVEE